MIVLGGTLVLRLRSGGPVHRKTTTDDAALFLPAALPEAREMATVTGMRSRGVGIALPTASPSVVGLRAEVEQFGRGG